MAEDWKIISNQTILLNLIQRIKQRIYLKKKERKKDSVTLFIIPYIWHALMLA